MIKRVAVLLAATLLFAAPAPSDGAPKSRRKAPDRKPPAASESRKIESPAPPPAPDNVPLPADNGIRAQLPAASDAPAAPTPAALPEPPPDPSAALGDDAEYNRRLVVQAVRAGLLKEGATAASLTPDVLNRMIDAHVLKDAIRHGLLPTNAVPSQVTPEIRAVMKKGGYFVHYYPDGSLNPNYGGKQE
jgi:hypothetical protein